MELSKILITELGEQQVIFLKETNGTRNFPILIGINEAMAIDRRLKGRSTPRPLTHELLANVIETMGGRVEKIVISDIRDHVFIAELYIKGRDGEIFQIDCRPSDAIALGSAFETPIFVAEHVLETVTKDPSAKDRIKILRDRMEFLAESIADLTARLTDEEYVATIPDDGQQEMRRQLEEMQSEYDAIDRVLKKLS